MQFEDRDDGEYRIHAGSLELQAGQGFLAAVVVAKICTGTPSRRELYRDLQVSGGHRWLTSDEALRQALLLGANAIRAERRKTARQLAQAAVPVAEST